MKEMFILSVGKYLFDLDDVPYQVATKIIRLTDELNSRVGDHRQTMTYITGDPAGELDGYLGWYAEQLEKNLITDDRKYINGRIKVEYSLRSLAKTKTMSVDMILDTDYCSFTYPPSRYHDTGELKAPNVIMDDHKWAKYL